MKTTPDRGSNLATGALGLLLGLGVGLVAACGGKEPEPAADVVVVDVAPPPPTPPVHPTTEEGVLTAFTQALEQRDIAAVRRFVAPELGAELTRMVQAAPDEFWARGQDWVVNAKTGLTLAARGDGAGTAERWNALVRFGNGQEERVTFTKADGKLVLADL
ncbi:MAG: hypothetical protein IT385_19825 [Deltaproteobacteria bacterium]|nr:hypothetical protein [Deltaproteobacteria bacterium]